ncbi:hypothetical protein [Cohnella silvisoli]|uniref:Uncharacterized protein n=1 Tax=Cohnella silvisoli TaxID=2873699 RepID=A0ABV1L289_9BACL|nr:hypothetical protein [Cohnella silvisoli]MCD9025774.1 hypothetical protein [Cohnella silvisoli]
MSKTRGTTGTPIPSRTVEMNSWGSGLCIPSKMTEEDWRKYGPYQLKGANQPPRGNEEMKASAFEMKDYLQLRLSGMTRKQIAKSKEYTLSHLENYWLKKWGIKDLSQEEIALAAAKPVSESLADAKQPRGLININFQAGQSETFGDATKHIAAELDQGKQKDAEIERLTREKDDYRQTATKLECKIDEYSALSLQLDIENERLKAEVASYISERENFNLAIDDLREQLRDHLHFAAEPISQEEVAVNEPRSARMIQTELIAPTEQIVDELAALICYLRSGNGQAFYLDLQLNEVSL